MSSKLFNRQSLLLLMLSISMLIFYLSKVHAKEYNGFDLENIIIDQSEVFSGGPDKDGIPSIDSPKFIAPNNVDFLHDNDMVMSFTNGSTTKAYPLRILVWHEIVNDSINGQAIAVTYCPLCGTGMVFDRMINGETKSFGVSGLLYRSDVLMYDRETLSLWSQLGMKGVTHQAIGHKLKWLPSEQLTWKAWQEKYPNGKVLSTDTGFNRQYASQAYASYFKSEFAMFPVPKVRTELKDKSKVIGIIVNGIAKAYPLTLLEKRSSFKDMVGSAELNIQYDKQKKLTTIEDTRGDPIASVEAYWFAWQGFYPETLLKTK